MIAVYGRRTPEITPAQGTCYMLQMGSLGLGLDLHFSVLVSIVESTLMQLLSACGERERVDAIFDLVPLVLGLGSGLRLT